MTARKHLPTPKRIFATRQGSCQVPDRCVRSTVWQNSASRTLLRRTYCYLMLRIVTHLGKLETRKSSYTKEEKELFVVADDLESSHSFHERNIFHHP